MIPEAPCRRPCRSATLREVTFGDWDPGRGATRMLRALLFAGVAVLASLAAHVAGGGAPPPPLVVTGVVLILAWAAVPLAGRRRGPASIVPAMVLLQLGLHHVFSLLSGSPGCAPALSGAGHAGAHLGSHLGSQLGAHAGGGAAVAGSGAACGHPMAGHSLHSMASGGPGLAMTLAHAAAAVALGLVLGHGERALWQIVGWLIARRPRVEPLPPVPGHAGARVGGRSVARPRPTVLHGAAGRRGPPSALRRTGPALA